MRYIDQKLNLIKKKEGMKEGKGKGKGFKIIIFFPSGHLLFLAEKNEHFCPVCKRNQELLFVITGVSLVWLKLCGKKKPRLLLFSFSNKFK